MDSYRLLEAAMSTEPTRNEILDARYQKLSHYKQMLWDRFMNLDLSSEFVSDTLGCLVDVHALMEKLLEE